MPTPFEELEYLADYLPDEGESVVVSRREGELVCESTFHGQFHDGISDPEFYGRLVQCNERLNQLSAGPLWWAVILGFWLCVVVHKLTRLGWEGWYLDVGVGLMVMMACFAWIRRRQAAVFVTEMRPMLNYQLRQRRLDRFSLLGALRQHPELRTLMSEMSRWDD